MITEALIKFWVNRQFKRFGRMLKLEIDSNIKSISIDILPKGEAESIQIKIGHYEILTGEVTGLKLGEITTSREWMTELIQAIVPTPTIKFDYAKLLKIIL